jgi:hypothetical protein
VVVRWTSTNPEHLALTATIDYSRDGGRSWRTIFVGPNTGRVSLESFFFTASLAARIRVRVNDGFNETSAVSGTFVAVGARPQVTIETQFAPTMREAGDGQVQLSGSAVDQAARPLSGRHLRWFDGPFLLGTGSEISAGPVPAGVNHIRLVARDSGGRTASASVTVTASAVRLPFLKLSIPKHAARSVGTLTFRASASIPTTLTIGRHRFKLRKKAKNFKLPIGRSARPLLLELSATADRLATPFAVRVTR